VDDQLALIVEAEQQVLAAPVDGLDRRPRSTSGSSGTSAACQR